MRAGPRRSYIPGGAPVLEGVRVANSAALAQLAPGLTSRGGVAYRAVSSIREHRASGRSRTRLRSAKMLSADCEFLGDCRVHDRSQGGARLALVGRVALPVRFRLYEDESGEANWVVVAWRRGATWSDAGLPAAQSVSAMCSLSWYSVPIRIARRKVP